MATTGVVIMWWSLTGCGNFGGDAVRKQWENRPSFASCGEVTLDMYGNLDASGQAGLRCLRQAFRSGNNGELIVHFHTTEGDPVTEYQRVTPTGTTEVYTDSTKDTNSDKKWSYGSCEDPGSALDFAC